ncbi:agmatinase family protein [Halomicroarcula sp. GCM10025709]|uniref:agmatinase family protein n=1 Tax=Haloarcula TaxID=2237 RepID=UPI0024C3CE00|nr:agmatinase family protein [Halomicroarcula sp. YJ-61-S]
MARSVTDPQLTTAPSPGYAGIKTFMGADTCEPDAVTPEVDAAAFGVPFDGGVTNQPGTRYGPQGLRAASSLLSRTFDSEERRYNIATDRSAAYDALELRDCGDAPVVPNDIEATYDAVEAYVGAIAEQTMPILLGGDHYLTYPSFVGYSQSVGEDVGLIQIDAHTDTWGSNELYGEHHHGSPMARIDESEYGGYENHAMIGIRGHADMEFLDILDDRGLYVDYAHEVADKGITESVQGAIEHATDGVDHVYLTIDIDGVDPSFAPGTGTPQPGGLTSSDLLRAVDLLGECREIGAVDLMEVAPTLDPTNTTSLLGANALSRFLQSYFYEQVA